MKRKTSKKKFRAGLRGMKEWLKQERSRMKKGELLQKARQKLEGHLNYYAVTDNWQECDKFSCACETAHATDRPLNQLARFNSRWQIYEALYRARTRWIET